MTKAELVDKYSLKSIVTKTQRGETIQEFLSPDNIVVCLNICSGYFYFTVNNTSEYITSGICRPYTDSQLFDSSYQNFKKFLENNS